MFFVRRDLHRALIHNGDYTRNHAGAVAIALEAGLTKSD